MVNQDLIGQKFGKLTVESSAGTNKWKHRLWECKCDCGNIVIVDTSRLRNGHTKSCGCLHPKAEDLAGKRFGKLTVVKKIGRKNRSNYWQCHCDCGNDVNCYQYNLMRGTSTSCGCLRSYYSKQSRNCHGESTGILYKKWSSIKTRCTNQNDPHYKDYGGRGIKLCDEWQEYWPFREWAYANGYQEDLTIERKDVNGNYCPENCCWITGFEQASNKRRSVFLEYGGKKQTISQWSRELGIGKETIAYRVHAGWSAEECLFGKKNRTGNSSPRMNIPDYLS